MVTAHGYQRWRYRLAGNLSKYHNSPNTHCVSQVVVLIVLAVTQWTKIATLLA
jgi:hypothetical protein